MALDTVMLGVLNKPIMLIVIVISVIMLNVVMPNDVAPKTAGEKVLLYLSCVTSLMG
jgi:hypothetical protein